MRTLVDFEKVPTQRLEVIRDSKQEGKLLMDALKAESACAAYREVLKNVLRSPVKERAKIADRGLFGKTDQRGKTMLKVVKAAVQVWWFQRKGTDKDFLCALAGLDEAMKNFELKGPTVRKWLNRKDLAYGAK